MARVFVSHAGEDLAPAHEVRQWLIETGHEVIAAICRRYGIAELSVFGSVAREEDHPDSDVDLLYVVVANSTFSLWEL